jgi:steroid delta-isomerase-like uncharacterized protein
MHSRSTPWPMVVVALAALTLGGCATHAGGRTPSCSTLTLTPGGRTLKEQHQRRVIERYFEEVWNQGRLEVLDELLAEDYVNHSSSLADAPPGPRGVKPIVAAMRAAFPDLHYTIERVVVDDDAVAVRVTMRGTHRGDFFGIPATGKSFAVTQMNLERFREGKIVEHWRNTDELGLMKQLGLIP